MAITIPNTFVAGTKIEATPMNANFAETANAVDKRGDTLTGNLGANAGITVDGVDVSTIPNTSGTFNPLFAQVVIGTADTNGIRLDLESGTLAVREGDDSAYGPLTSGLLTTSGNHVPATNDGGSLGISGTAWADLFLASGAVINFNAGDVTVTHSSNTLTFAGAASGYIFNDGNLGLGVTPSYDLHLQKASAAAGSVITALRNTTATGATRLYLGNDSSDSASYFQIFGTTHALRPSVIALGGNAAYPLCFDTSGSERMRIDTSGNVGIGVTPGSVKLDIVGSTDVIRVASNATNATTKESKWLLRHYTNAEEDVMFAYVYSTSTANEIYLGGGASAQNAATQISFSTAATNTTVAGTERLRITSGGNVAIGATAKLYLDGVAGTGDTYIYESAANTLDLVAGGINIIRCTTTGALINNTKDLTIGATAKFYLDGGGDTYITEVAANNIRVVAGGSNSASFTSTFSEVYGDFYVQAAKKLHLDGGGDSYLSEVGANVIRVTVGGVSAVQWDTTGMYLNTAPPTSASAANAVVSSGSDYLRRSTSSIRYKHDIATLDTTDALSAVMAMRPVTYRGKTDEDQRRFVGFIAEEMQEIAPLLCTYDEGGESGTPNYVTYDRVTAYLVAVVQQQQQKIAALEARIH